MAREKDARKGISEENGVASRHAWVDARVIGEEVGTSCSGQGREGPVWTSFSTGKLKIIES